VTQEKEQPPEPVAAPRRYCRGCFYDLSGNAEWRCPECGRAYDPHDLTTTTVESNRRGRFLRAGIILAIFLALISGVYHTIIPRPRSLNNWQLWIWLWEPYGIQHTWMGSSPGRAYYWAGNITRAEADSRTNQGLRWRIDYNRWTSEWRISSHEPGVDWRELTQSYSAMKKPMFGVIFHHADQPVTDAPFDFVGNTHEAMTMLVNRFELRLETMRMSESQPYVWVFDEKVRRMVPVEVTDENRHLYRLRADLADRTLMPKEPEPDPDPEGPRLDSAFPTQPE